MLEDTPELYKGLTYPWSREVNPTPGQAEQIADGVYWVRFPMPMSLDHINIWLLEDGDGWTVVDTCLNLGSAREIWEQLFSSIMGDRPIRRVICTHMHPDHVGLAGWLTERFGAELWMSREEFLMCRAMVSDTGREAPAVALRFYQAAGYNEDQLSRYKGKFGNFGRAVSTLPESFRRIVDLETITIGGRYWQVIVGSGHSPEHAALYCPAIAVSRKPIAMRKNWVAAMGTPRRTMRRNSARSGYRADGCCGWCSLMIAPGGILAAMPATR